MKQGKLFIIGGGSRPASLINTMIDEAGLRTEGYAVVLPMSTMYGDEAMASGKKQFTDNGIKNATAFNFEKGDTPNPVLLDSIRLAKLIYISGGDQNRFMGIVAGTEIEKAIWDCFNNGGMIAGTSAGAAVMSEKMITGNQIKSVLEEGGFQVIERQNVQLANGLGLIKSAIIDQHFVKRSRYNRLLTLSIENPDLKCIGIDESTAIIVAGNMVRVVGSSQVLVFDAQGIKAKVKGEKLGQSGLKLSVYLDGDTFSLQ